TIQELFESQVEKTPDNIAVIFEDKKLTYRELNEKSNSLARILRTKGVKADSIVAIMIDKSVEMIIGIMGILKAGGAYLPIDPSSPSDRIKYMLKDSGTNILLKKDVFVKKLEFSGEVIELFDSSLFVGDINKLEKGSSANNLAYVIYTSGTTGKPKGVLIEHRNVVNLLNHMQIRYPIQQNDVYLLKTNYIFDVSVTELFSWFMGGGTLAINKHDNQKDMNNIIDSIKRYKVTHINFVPSMLSVFNEVIGNDLEKVNSLKYVLAAGEELKPRVVYDFYNKFNNVKLENLYGPTETTVYASMYSTDKGKQYRSIPIGVSTQNAKLFVVNNNKLQPVGIPGELCISGDGLARGYLNNQELTAEKFVDNPFEQGTKMYKTGDLVRWLTDGNIEFLGRIDNQVKIRGFRIELGEIENKLLKHEDVKEATVIVIEGKEDDKHICAYIISDKEINELNLKEHLKENLPEYMVPSYFVKLEEMPITSNGKLDRRALSKPNLDERLTSYEAPRNNLEQTLIRIWSQVLGIDKIGINDNFFELGGHSLRAMVLISKIHKELNKEITLKELFKLPTIKELNELIENSQENPYSKIQKVEEREYYEASSAQKRMYIIKGFDKESIAYNMPEVFEIEGIIDKNKIEDTFRKLVKRHEALRTYFE
ncbi:non-ribosomal peptide synthetase, partial [Clostridium frigidicarnis]